jgi:alginate O-acetyltransferase complex protein AlgI
LRNLFLVMALGGLWHGADWRFAVWGGLHGIFLVLLRIKWWVWGKPEYERWYQVAFGVFITFSVVVFTRVFFRAESVTRALEVFSQMFTFTWGLQRVSGLAWTALGGCVLFYVLPVKAFEVSTKIFIRMPVPVRAAVLVGLGLVVKSISNVETQPYIYRQF